MNDLISIKTAAKMLNVHVNTIQKYIKTGLLTPYRASQKGWIKLSVQEVQNVYRVTV